jgi:hypothetical protein
VKQVVDVLSLSHSVVPSSYLDESCILLGEPDVVWGILWKLMQSNAVDSQLDSATNSTRSSAETDILHWLWRFKVLDPYSSEFVYVAPRNILQIQVRFFFFFNNFVRSSLANVYLA